MLVPMRAILEAADQNGYAQAAFNINNISQIEATVKIHEIMESPALLQGAEASNAYMSGNLDFMHGTLEDKAAGAKVIGDTVKKYGADSPIPVALHLDHGKTLEIHLCHSFLRRNVVLVNDHIVVPFGMLFDNILIVQ